MLLLLARSTPVVVVIGLAGGLLAREAAAPEPFAAALAPLLADAPVPDTAEASGAEDRVGVPGRPIPSQGFSHHRFDSTGSRRGGATPRHDAPELRRESPSLLRAPPSH